MGTVYEQGVHESGDFIWDVALAEIGPGNSNAGIETERAIQTFQPHVVFFVGVAGGVKDVNISDVVVGSKIYAYESGADATAFLPRPEMVEPSHVMLQRARAEAKRADWHQYLVRRPDSLPRVVVGAIAAGEKVVKSRRSTTAKFLKHAYSDVLAVEMEGRGFLEAAHANKNIDALVIRGISDLLSKKNVADASGSQPLAAANAAAFMFTCLDGLSKVQKSTSPDFIDLDSPVLPMRFDLLRQRVVLDIQDSAGAAVYFEKAVTIRAAVSGVETYTDNFALDGTVEDVSVTPGRVEYVVVKDGSYVFLTRFASPLPQGRTINRILSGTFRDSFLREQEYWQVGPPHPHEGTEVIVRFPPERRAKRVWSEGTDTRPEVDENGNGAISQVRWQVPRPSSSGRCRLTWEW